MLRLSKTVVFLCMGMILTGNMIGCGSSGGEDGPEAQKIAKWVVSKGGFVKITGSNIKINKTSKIPEGDLGISEINLNNIEHKAIDLEKIAQLSCVTYLGLHSSPISDNSLSHITGLKTLQELELSNSNVSDKGLDVIADELPNLKKLYLYDTAPGITDDGVKAFEAKRPNCKVFR